MWLSPLLAVDMLDHHEWLINFVLPYHVLILTQAKLNRYIMLNEKEDRL